MFSHRPPLSIQIVTALTIVIAVALFPIDHIYRHLWFVPIYFVICAALIYGVYAGARWVFVVNVLTAWIFPFETFKGIKQPITGTVLSVLNLVGLVLMFAGWRYFWGKRSEQI